MVICRAIALGAVIQHIDHPQKVGAVGIGDIFDDDVVNADNATGWPRQVQPEMRTPRVGGPDHVHARACAGADDGRNLDNLAIAGQCGRRAGGRQRRQFRAALVADPCANRHIRQDPCHAFDPRPHPQIGAWCDGQFHHPAQAGCGTDLLHLKTAVEIRVGRNESREARAVIARCARPAGGLGPDIQPGGERGGGASGPALG